jgi:hypothetical protein
MPPGEALYPLIALISVGTFTLIGMRMWLNARIERLRGGSREEVERLSEAVERLYHATQLMREELGELQERMDFAERLLTRGDAREKN